MLNMAICDDDAQDLADLESCLLRCVKERQLEAACDAFLSLDGFLAAFTPGRFQLVFLDIYMHGKGPLGVSAAEEIRARDPQCVIVFTTSSTDHAVESYRIGVLHYLVKPVTAESVDECFRRAEPLLLENLKVVRFSMRGGEYELPQRAICYIEVYNKKSIFHTDTDTLETYTPLSVLEEQLDGENFLRIHRSYIVNLAYAAQLEDEDVLLTDGTRVPFSRRKKGLVQKRFFQTVMERTRKMGNGVFPEG